MSDIPKATKLLREAKKLINEALALMPRDRKQPRGPSKANKITPAIKARILWLRAKHPKMLLREIANDAGVKVDGGRVSEVLNGKR